MAFLNFLSEFKTLVGMRRVADGAIPCARMGIYQTRAAAVQLFPQRTVRILSLVDATALQFRYDKLDKVAKRLMRQRVGKIEAVDVGLFDPRLQLIGNFLRTTYRQRPKTTYATPLRDLPYGPYPRRIC